MSAIINKQSKIYLIRKDDPRQLSVNLSAKEYACKCRSKLCHLTLVDPNLIKSFQKLRGTYGKPIRVTSGFRCINHNKKVGGLLLSYHTRGMAIDLAPGESVNAPHYKYELERLRILACDFFDVIIVYDDQGFVHCHNR